MATATAPGLPEIERARERLDGVARVTPVFPSETLSRLAGRPVRLKAENLQRTGSFKIRGAYVKLSSLEAERLAAGVVAASAGNHGQAVAWAARELGAPARIFMPQDSPMAKVDATRNYGAEVELTGPAFEETLEAAKEYAVSIKGPLTNPVGGGIRSINVAGMRLSPTATSMNVTVSMNAPASRPSASR